MYIFVPSKWNNFLHNSVYVCLRITVFGEKNLDNELTKILLTTRIYDRIRYNLII